VDNTTSTATTTTITTTTTTSRVKCKRKQKRKIKMFESVSIFAVFGLLTTIYAAPQSRYGSEERHTTPFFHPHYK